jgi:hypothetical protein
MTQEFELFETISLENGLVLHLYNGSRVIADRLWFVSLTGKVEIPITAAAFENPGRQVLDIEAIKAALGTAIIFEKKMERNFIFEDKKASTLQAIRDYFTDSIVKYLSHPDFSRQYILKRYREYQKKEKLEASQLAFNPQG